MIQQFFNFKVENPSIKELDIQGILILIRNAQLESIFLPLQYETPYERFGS